MPTFEWHIAHVLYLNSATRNAWIILDRFLQPALLLQHDLLGQGAIQAYHAEIVQELKSAKSSYLIPTSFYKTGGHQDVTHPLERAVCQSDNATSRMLSWMDNVSIKCQFHLHNT